MRVRLAVQDPAELIALQDSLRHRRPQAWPFKCFVDGGWAHFAMSALAADQAPNGTWSVIGTAQNVAVTLRILPADPAGSVAVLDHMIRPQPQRR